MLLIPSHLSTHPSPLQAAALSSHASPLALSCDGPFSSPGSACHVSSTGVTCEEWPCAPSSTLLSFGLALFLDPGTPASLAPPPLRGGPHAESCAAPCVTPSTPPSAHPHLLVRYLPLWSLWMTMHPIPWCSPTIWVPRTKEFLYDVPDLMLRPRVPPGRQVHDDMLI